MGQEQEILQRDICNIFSNLVSRLNARTVFLTDSNPCLISVKVILWLPMDREGMDVYYIRDECNGQLLAYRVSLLLALRANCKIVSGLPASTNWREEIIAGATWIVKALQAVGSDILTGDERWIKDSEIEPVSVPLEIAPIIRRELLSRAFTRIAD